MTGLQKKVAIIAVAVLIAIIALASAVNAATYVQTVKAHLGVKIFYDGKQLTDANQPYLINDRTYVPLRMLMDHFGDKEITWDPVRYYVIVKTKAGMNVQELLRQVKEKDAEIARLKDTNAKLNARIRELEAELEDEQDTSVSELQGTLSSYFSDAGEDYFDDDGIDFRITLSGDEDDLYYTIKLDFDDAYRYDDLTDVSQTKIKSLMNAVKSKLNAEIEDTDFEDADITGKLVDNDNSRYYVNYDGSSYYFSWDERSQTSVTEIKNKLVSYFNNAGDYYFNDDGIKVTIGLSGNQTKLSYTIIFDFDNADHYDNLTKLSQADIKVFLDVVKYRINSEIYDTDFEGAVITGKLIDNDDYNYYVVYNGSSYSFSWK